MPVFQHFPPRSCTFSSRTSSCENFFLFAWCASVGGIILLEFPFRSRSRNWLIQTTERFGWFFACLVNAFMRFLMTAPGLGEFLKKITNGVVERLLTLFPNITHLDVYGSVVDSNVVPPVESLAATSCFFSLAFSWPCMHD